MSATEPTAEKTEETTATPETEIPGAAPKEGEPSAPAARKRPAWTATAGLLLAVIAILIGGAGIGAGYWAWQQTHSALAMQASQIQTLKQALADKVSRDHLAAYVDKTEQLESQQQAQAQALSAFGKALHQSQVLNQRDQRGWTLAEAEYLMRIARYRLDLLRDPQGAADALSQADQRLAHLGDPEMLPVRRDLAAEVQSLHDYQAPDKVGVLLRLDQVMSQILLPTPLGAALLDHSGQPAPASAARTSGGTGGVRGFLAAVWHSISEHVSIRHYPQRINDLAVVTSQGQAAQSLYLYLENARAAVLAEDDKAYHQSIADILNTLKQTSGDPALRAGITQTLDKLNAIDIAPPLPKIGAALIRLQKLAAPKSTEAHG